MVTIFVVCWVITLIYAIRLMLSLSSSTANYGVIEGKQVIRRVPHPEMMEVKPGDELMVVKFGDDSNNSGIYSCADSWCETQVTTNGVVSYYKAYYRRK